MNGVLRSWTGKQDEEMRKKSEATKMKKIRRNGESNNLTKTLHVLKSGSIKILKHKTPVPY